MIFGGNIPDYLQQTGVFLSLYGLTYAWIS